MPALFVRLSFSPALLAYGLRHGPVRSRLREQLAALQLNDFKVISRAMKESLSNFGFEGFVTTFQVDYVGLFHNMLQTVRYSTLLR